MLTKSDEPVSLVSQVDGQTPAAKTAQINLSRAAAANIRIAKVAVFEMSKASRGGDLRR